MERRNYILEQIEEFYNKLSGGAGADFSELEPVKLELADGKVVEGIPLSETGAGNDIWVVVRNRLCKAFLCGESETGYKADILRDKSGIVLKNFFIYVSSSVKGETLQLLATGKNDYGEYVRMGAQTAVLRSFCEVGEPCYSYCCGDERVLYYPKRCAEQMVEEIKEQAMECSVSEDRLVFPWFPVEKEV